MATVTVSRALRQWFPKVFKEITQALMEHGHKWKFGGIDKNIWIRDYSLNGFGYRRRHQPCQIILDGGNVVEAKDAIFITERALHDNPRRNLLRRLEFIFEKAVVLLPIEPGDDLGHSDGLVVPVDHKRVLTNDYQVMQSREWDRYQKKLIRAIERAGFKAEIFPFAYHKCPQMTEAQFRRAYPMGDANNACAGYYLNMLVLPNVVLLPVFGFAEDAKAMRAAGQWFDGEVWPVPCFELSMLGGCIHCVTHDAA